MAADQGRVLKTPQFSTKVEIRDPSLCPIESKMFSEPILENRIPLRDFDQGMGWNSAVTFPRIPA
jgi:hypothetical protein